MSAFPYMLPVSTVANPRNLTLTQFIQTVFVGISGLAPTLTFPKWQVEPPKQPDINVSWMALGISESLPDANAYIGISSTGAATTQRHAKLEVSCDIYGPQAFEIADLIRDGFQIPSNLGALAQTNMGIVEVGRAMHLPELVNERFINRVNMSVYFRHETLRTYPILSFISANGIIYNGSYELLWRVPTTDFLTTQSGDILETQDGEPIVI